MMSSRALRPVSAPLSSTPLPRLIYILTTLSVLLISYYSYRGLQYKSAVGGWWNGALGRRTPIIINGDESVEDRINGLARVLGIPSKELASAIAGAVRQNVPPASTVMESLLKMEEEKMPQAGMVEQVMNFGGMDDELD